MVQHRMAAMLERLAARHPVLSLDAIEQMEDLNHDAPALWHSLRDRLIQASHDRALSLHLEPDGEQLRIRHRLVTGLEESRVSNDSELARVIALVAGRLRKQSERRCAASGFFFLTIDRMPLVAEALILPCVQGDTLHLRLFPDPDARPQLDELGMTASQSRQCRELLASSNGLIVVSGRDRLERQRTVRALAQELISPDRRILSVEPVVHPLIPGCLQMPVTQTPWEDQASNETLIDVCDIDCYFLAADASSEWSSWLLDEAVETALVVHGTESTDSARILSRLLANGATPAQLAQGLTAIISQHSVLSICSQCSRPARVDPGCERIPLDTASLAGKDISAWLSHSLTHRYVEAEGCDHCQQSGYGELVQLYAITRMNATSRDHLLAGRINMAARELDAGREISAQAMTMAQESRIALPEALRVTRERQSAAPRF